LDQEGAGWCQIARWVKAEDISLFKNDQGVTDNRETTLTVVKESEKMGQAEGVNFRR